ncbi:MAG: dihydrofolate reductase [Candidatus Puniceispirillaceae bacterium]
MTNYNVVAVVAMAANRVIGDGDDLLWHLPGDLRRVKALTMGCPLIMGRKTWDSIGRPLPGRASIVLTRDKTWQAEGAIAVSSLEEAFEEGAKWLADQGTGETRQILFGGGQIYALGLDRCSVIEMTEVDLTPDGPAVFPDIDASWAEVSREEVPAEKDVPAHRFIRYEKR